MNSRIKIGKTDMKVITDSRYWLGYMVCHIFTLERHWFII